MAVYKLFLCAGCLLSVVAYGATKFEKKETIKGVTLQTGKKDSSRVYRGSVSKTFPQSLELVKSEVMNFTGRCNNSYKDRRRYTDKKYDCKHHNANLVESFIIKDLKTTGWQKETNEVDRFLIGRQIYNRGSYGHYEIVQVFETLNDKNQKTVKIVQRMLNDKEVKKYISPKFSKDSAFENSIATFILTEVSPTETAFEYEYIADTEHWILNKEISVPQVFSSMSKSINDLVDILTNESKNKIRDLASN